MSSKKTVPSGKLTEALVVIRQSPGMSSMKALLQNAERETGLKAHSVMELANLHAFNVRAPCSFVDAIAKAPAVQEVIRTGSEDSAMIAPVAKRKVRLDEVSSFTGKSRLK